jgi:hypothetical protein
MRLDLTKYWAWVWPDGQLGRYLLLVVLSGLAVLLCAIGQRSSHGMALPLFIVLGALAEAVPIPLEGASLQASNLFKEVVEQNEQLASVHQIQDRRAQELQTLCQVSLGLNHSQSLTGILNQILQAIADLTDADASAIFLYEPDHETLRVGGHIGFTSEYVAEAQPALNGSASQALREGQPLVVCEQGMATEMLSVVAIREGVQTAACLPLKVDGQIVGSLDVCFKSLRAFREDELGILGVLAQQAAIAIHKAQLIDQVHQSYLGTIQALAAAVEAKDPYTRGHSERVCRLAVAMGQEMGLDKRQLRLLNLAALFHDIGKIGVPESILSKPAPLTPGEMELIRQHPVWAEPILRHVPDMPELTTIVRHHHERFDGQGYPDGVSSQHHPLSAIICVADAYDTMTSDRPYRKPLNHEEALEELRRHTGTQFMPQAVEGFVRVMAKRRILSLDDYRIPLVVFRAPVWAKSTQVTKETGDLIEYLPSSSTSRR